MALWARSLQAAGATVDRVLITRLGEWRAGSHHHQVEQQQVDKMSCCVGACKTGGRWLAGIWRLDAADEQAEL
jgi:hypothetical protein